MYCDNDIVYDIVRCITERSKHLKWIVTSIKIHPKVAMTKAMVKRLKCLKRTDPLVQ